MPLPVQLRDKQASSRFYDDRYKNGYMEDWPLWKRRRVLEIIREQNLPESGTALDFGCGNGVFTKVLHEALPGWRVFGVDVSNVAIEHARRDVPQCTFFHSEDPQLAGLRFDFVFTHHVLEHVYDLDAAWDAIVGSMKPVARMLHVAPCGNRGSLEYELSRLRTEEAKSTLGNRFFFDEEGHVRRLTTEQLISKAEPAGFRLVREYYAGQYYGAIDWLSGNGVRFVLSLCDLAKAKDAQSRNRLRHLRTILLPLAAMKSILRCFADWKSTRRRSVKNWAVLLLGGPFAIIANCAARRLTGRVNREWQTMKTNRHGSEMYLYFERAARSGGHGDVEVLLNAPE